MAERFQTIVVGAGVAGVAAALASARHGAKTLLIEAGVCAGGLGSAGLVPCFTPFSYKEYPLIGGIAAEIHDKLTRHGGSNNGSWALIDAEWMKYVCDELLTEAGVDVRYLTTFCSAKTGKGKLLAIEVQDRERRYWLEADNFIDTTGDAAVAFAAGVPVKNGDAEGHTQPGSCCFVIAGVEPEKLLPEDRTETCVPGMIHLTNALRKHIREWIAEGKLVNVPEFEFHVPGASLDLKTGVARINFGHLYELGSCKAEKISRMLIEGRRRIREFVECLRKNMPGMEKIVLVNTPSIPDIRESRRIVGRLELTADAYWKGETHLDDVGIYDYMVDVHALSLAQSQAENPDEPVTYQQVVEHSMAHYYGIPFRILLTKEFDNLAVAGRIVSADQAMLGSLRVMPASMTTGQAAGTAAALSTPLSLVDVRKLREVLERDGVILSDPGKRQ